MTWICLGGHSDMHQQTKVKTMIEITTRDRMISAAVTLFAHAGFHGITTKDIAQSANVSESNIFRYFPSKRDLFIAAVDAELGKLSVFTEFFAQSTRIEDSHIALRTLFEQITHTVVNQPDLVRLLHFSALEFGPDLEPVYRKHLDPIINASAQNFEKWTHDYGFRDLSAQVTVLSFVATVLLLQSYPLFTSSAFPFPSVKSAAAEYADLWYRLLSGAGVTGSPVRESLVSGVNSDLPLAGPGCE